MSTVHMKLLFTASFLALAILPAQETIAQRPGSPASSDPAEKADASKTTVSVELLLSKDGGALQAQGWAQTFERLGVAVRVRQPLLDDKPEVKERKAGRLRYVTVIGTLDRSGQLVFSDRTFRRSDAAKLGDWLRELQTYGAQGAPDGKPLWGLSKEQFESIYAALAVKQDQSLKGLPVEQAVARLASEKYPVRLTAEARIPLLEGVGDFAEVRQEVAGLTKGTALAIVLGEQGLGYRPLRTPDGAIELAVEPLDAAPDAWPVGWDLKDPRQKTAPKLYELVPVELDDVPLTDLVAAISTRSGVPVFLDYERIAAKGIDLDDLRVTYPSRRTSWSLLLKSATTPHKLARRLKIDEQGRPLVWITIFEPGRTDDL